LDFFSPMKQQPPRVPGPPLLSSLHNHIQTYHTRQNSSGRVISLTQIPAANNTQRSQQTDNPAPHGIRTHNSSRRMAADPLLKPRGHWDLPCC
jgi:hypothetical protein